MNSSAIYEAKQMKNGKWRIHEVVSQAIIAWRGTNDKSTVVRDEGYYILNFNSLEEAQAWTKENLKRNVHVN